MSTWFSDLWTSMVAWFQGLAARDVASYIGGKLLDGLFQAIAVAFVGWIVLYRQWRQLTQGRSDQVVFSANVLTPISGPSAGSSAGDRYVLQLRTVLPPRTIDQILDNVALRRMMRSLAEEASLVDPVLATEGTAGFEIVTDIVNNVSGSLASAPFKRDQWLLAVTCEDRKVVRKCCIRVLLIRRADLVRLASWDWCRDHVQVEMWYHYWRIVTLHQIALRFQKEQARQQAGRIEDVKDNLMPLVDPQAHHPRIRLLSLGINVDEPIIAPPLAVDWERYMPQMEALGLKLSGIASPSSS